MKELLEQIKEEISILDVDKLDFDSQIILRADLRQMLYKLQFIKRDLL